MNLRIPNFRYVVAAMLLLATMINYADRLAISVVAPTLRKYFGMAPLTMASAPAASSLSTR